jgi:glutathione S-transferase
MGHRGQFLVALGADLAAPRAEEVICSRAVELITIKFSHYNEKARWALDRFGVAYEERGYLPMIHMPFALARSRFMRGWDGTSTAATTPVLFTGRSVIADSEEILKYLSGAYGTPENNLYPIPEAAALSARFSGSLGSDTRRVAYHHAFQSPELLRRVVEANAPGWQARAFLALLPAIMKALRWRLEIRPEAVERSLERIWEEVAFVNGLLADGRNYLVAERFTAADLTFSCMMAISLLIQPHEGFGATLPPLDLCPPAVQELARGLRATPAGQFVLRMFAEERSRRAPLG